MKGFWFTVSVNECIYACCASFAFAFAKFPDRHSKAWIVTFLFLGKFYKEGSFFSFFFQSNFYVMGTKVVGTIHDHYTEFSYCMVKVLQNQRGTCI